MEECLLGLKIFQKDRIIKLLMGGISNGGRPEMGMVMTESGIAMMMVLGSVMVK